MKNINYLWKDRKRTILGLPISFTTYRLTEEKLLISIGLFNTIEEEVRLYRIMDITLRRSFWQKIFGVGTIHCCSADKSTPEFNIESVKKPIAIKEMLSKMIEEERDRKRISGREYMASSIDDDDYDIN